jgi:hypothetical protein
MTDKPLLQCTGCGYWTRWRNTWGRCQHCVLGWIHCAVHGRLEHATGDPDTHRKVTVSEVIAAIPEVPRVA